MQRASLSIKNYLHAWNPPPALVEMPGSIWLQAVWFGLFTGLIEICIPIAKYLLGSLIFMSPDFIWFWPLSEILLFGLAGGILVLLARRWPKLSSIRNTVFIYSLLSAFSLLLMFSKISRPASFLLAVGLAVTAVRVFASNPKRLYIMIYFTLGWPILIFKRLRTKKTVSQPVNPPLLTDPAISRREFLVVAGAMVGGLALGVRGWGFASERAKIARLPVSSRKFPNVILITLDTVRAKSLSLYGYHRPTTPALERLAKTGAVFRKAIATAPWTLPSHASMFTGYYPNRLSVDWFRPLDKTYPTLAEVLSSFGYLTAGFVANNVCSYTFGLNRGFAHFEDYETTPGQVILSSAIGRTTIENPKVRGVLGYHQLIGRKSVEHINHDFLRWLSRNQGERPFFAFLNYFDAHEPYIPPAEYSMEYAGKKPTINFNWEEVESLSEAEIREFNDYYDALIAYIDDHIGKLYRNLEQMGVLEDTLLIITSDHGEQFGEHGLMEHGNSLYMPNLHVPLLLSYPAIVPENLDVFSEISLRDIAATVLDFAGLSDHVKFPGSSLARFWSDEAQTNPGKEALISQVHKGVIYPSWYPTMKGALDSVIYDGVHYIKNEGDGAEELYDLTSDPTEMKNLVQVNGMTSLLEDMRRLAAQPG